MEWPLSHTTRKTKDVEKALGGDPSLFLCPPPPSPLVWTIVSLMSKGGRPLVVYTYHTPSSFAESMAAAKHIIWTWGGGARLT